MNIEKQLKKQDYDVETNALYTRVTPVNKINGYPTDKHLTTAMGLINHIKPTPKIKNIVIRKGGKVLNFYSVSINAFDEMVIDVL